MITIEQKKTDGSNVNNHEFNETRQFIRKI